MYPDTRLHYTPPHPPGPVAITHEQILGMCQLGLDDQHQPWPVQSVLMPVLGPATASLQEMWHTRLPAQDGRFGDVHYRRAGNLLFGVITLEEAQFAGQDGSTALQKLAEHAYRQLFALLDAQQCPHLWRVWNYIPRINVEEHGMERYRQFNIGRHQAFAGSQRPVHGSPAACALGTASGPVSIAFLAANSPALPIENPRQVSAFAYPQQYGPVSPTFSRAALAGQSGAQWLFISGTASIIGHLTVHAGDVAAQTAETFANIAILLAQANSQQPRQPFTLAGLDYRVYIRHAADYPAVRAAVLARLGEDSRVVYVQADICRADLLVEIEAQGCC
jgi:chorismate lyase/3-hydroxybenzoate synthase